jgi:hypothetical protein
MVSVVIRIVCGGRPWRGDNAESEESTASRETPTLIAAKMSQEASRKASMKSFLQGKMVMTSETCAALCRSHTLHLETTPQAGTQD